MFPSLVNCCTIDWFNEWRPDVLTAVADTFLKKVEMDDKTRDSCSEMLEFFRVSAFDWAQKYDIKLNGKIYITPIIYWEVVKILLALQ